MQVCDYIEKSYSCIFATQKWSKTFRFLFKHWLVCNRQYQEDSRMLKNPTFKYEDFTSKPHEVLLQVSELLAFPRVTKEWEVKQGVNQNMWSLGTL